MIHLGTSGGETFTGTAGTRDVFRGFQGNDTFLGNGGPDHDTADYSFDFAQGGNQGIRVNLSANQSQGGLAPDTARDSFGFFDYLPGVRDVIGTRFNDVIYGGGHANVLVGGAGKDLISAGRGKDTVNGGLGADKLWGGKDADTFTFGALKDSTVSSSGRDTIYDFSHKERDRIHLSAIDANTKAGGNQAFTFIGKDGFHNKAGELRYQQTGGGALVLGDVNGDGKADFAIFLKGVTTLVKGDFYL